MSPRFLRLSDNVAVGYKNTMGPDGLIEPKCVHGGP